MNPHRIPAAPLNPVLLPGFLNRELAYLQNAILSTTGADLVAHIADTTDAHDASAISTVPAGNLAAVNVQTSLAELDAEKQPLDADLTSWAAVTRAAGFDTFAGTPSSANLRGLLTDESGTGAAYFQGGNIGTPSAGVATNLTGTATGLAAGTAAKWTTARNLAGNSVDGSANVAFSNKFIVQGTTDTGLSAAQFLGALATGIVKNATTTGVLSIAVAGDFPTLNQSTTGSAATLTTPRAIYGNNFDGSAALGQIIASTYGGTGNGFAKFSGPATAEKTFTLPNASATILTSNAAVTVAQGGTGDTGTAWTTYTPTITAGSGTFTTVSAAGAYKDLGKTRFINVRITITTNGTAASYIVVPMPSGTAVRECVVHGRESQTTGKGLVGVMSAATANMLVTFYDSTYPGGSGYILTISAVIEMT